MNSVKIENFYVYLVILTILQRGMAECITNDAVNIFTDHINEVSIFFTELVKDVSELF